MATTETLFPLPGTFQDRPLVGYMSSRRGDCDHWSEIKRWAADLFSADEDDIDSEEIFWGGTYGDDESCEALTVKGDIVGVWKEPLDEQGWRDMLAAYAMQREPVASFQIAAE